MDFRLWSRPYLFRHHTNSLHPIPYHSSKSYNYQEEQERLLAERTEAVAAILAEVGVEALIEFSIGAENTGDLGQILAEKVLRNSYDFDLILRIRTENYALYTSILWALFLTNGLEKLICILKTSERLTDEEKGDILCHTPPSPKVWDTVDDMAEATVRYYWEHIDAFRLDNKYSSYQDYFLD